MWVWSDLLVLASSVSLTAAVMELPWVSVSLLEVLAGSWVSALAYWRRMLCLLDQFYILQRGRQQHDIVANTALLRAELFCLCALAPLVATDPRAASSGLLVASDASDDLGANAAFIHYTMRSSAFVHKHMHAHNHYKPLASHQSGDVCAFAVPRCRLMHDPLCQTVFVNLCTLHRPRRPKDTRGSCQRCETRDTPVPLIWEPRMKGKPRMRRNCLQRAWHTHDL